MGKYNTGIDLINRIQPIKNKGLPLVSLCPVDDGYRREIWESAGNAVFIDPINRRMTLPFFIILWMLIWHAGGKYYTDYLVKELLRYFKQDFFKWCNKPDCNHCGQNTSENMTPLGSQGPMERNLNSIAELLRSINATDAEISLDFLVITIQLSCWKLEREDAVNVQFIYFDFEVVWVRCSLRLE
ncbi:hypothetical protein FOB22_001150 [Saccharomyces cerevisiae]|nr:hypothetical protein FOB22_001150 [Saccharomyces cerevisiae]